MHNEKIEFFEIIEHVEEIYTSQLPGYYCSNCKRKFYYLFTQGSGDLIIGYPLDANNVVTNNCDLHINHDLILDPVFGVDVIIPKSYEMLSGNKIVMMQTAFGRLFLADERMN